MKIEVKCDCGKILKVPQQYAGKRGRCPQCARMLKIPMLARPNQESSEVKTCPTCGSYLAPDQEFCVSCQTNLRTGQLSSLEVGYTKYYFTWQRMSMLMLGYIIVIGLPISIYILWQHMYLPRISFAVWEKEYPKIKDMPDRSLQQIDAKIKTMEKQWENIPKSIVESFRIIAHLQLVQKAKETDPDNEANIFLKCLKLKALSEITLDSADKMKLLASQKEMSTYLRQFQGQIEQVSKEGRTTEILTRITPELLSIFQQVCDSSICHQDLQKSWTELLQTYKKLKDKDGITFTVKPKDRSDKDISHYREKLDAIVSSFELCMKERRYGDAQKVLETFWDELNKKLNESDAPDIFQKTRQYLKEVQSVKTLFAIANDGARGSIGTRKTFFTREGSTITGSIIQYSRGEFSVQTQDGIEKVFLYDLKHDQIVFFANSVQKNKHVYEFTGVFYFYEQEFSQAETAFLTAKEMGANTQQISYYLRRIEESVKK